MARRIVLEVACGSPASAREFALRDPRVKRVIKLQKSKRLALPPWVDYDVTVEVRKDQGKILPGTARRGTLNVGTGQGTPAASPGSGP